MTQCCLIIVVPPLFAAGAPSLGLPGPAMFYIIKPHLGINT